MSGGFRIQEVAGALGGGVGRRQMAAGWAGRRAGWRGGGDGRRSRFFRRLSREEEEDGTG